VSHVSAGAFQEAGGIGQTGAMKEADVDVSGKDADVGKRNVTNASGGQPVVHQFSNVGTAAPHPCEPSGRQGPQLARLYLEPGRNRRIALDSSIESQESGHD
jgi:hypothetical protein